jgi:DNA-binding NarL/FixJ family response regulator
MTVPGSEAVVPVTIALARDHEIVHHGLARMLEPFAQLARLVDHPHRADITLVDPDVEPGSELLARALSDPRCGRVVLFGWRLDAPLVNSALSRGAGGFVAKSLSADQLVGALRDIRDGTVVVSETDGGTWEEFQVELAQIGLTPRETDVIALITSGHSNAEIAGELFVSINSVKSYIRSAYRKLGVTTRARAVLWGIEHGMHRDVVPLRTGS